MKHSSKLIFLFLATVLINRQTQAQTNTFPTTGNVGIGTLSPGYLLDVNGSARIGSSLYLNTGSQIMTANAGGGNWDFQNGSGGGWYFRWIQNSATAMTLSASNNLLIGTTTDGGYKLSVNGSLKATAFNLPTGATAGYVLTSDASGNATWQAGGSSSGWALGGNTVSTIKTLGTVDNNDLPVITHNIERMRIIAAGNVLIGKTSQTNSTYILDVNGNIRANSVVVNTTGADFVFDPGYGLLPLADVKQYIQAFHHLPGIASAAQMQDQGVDLGNNQTRLLQKIEELTLYMIDQDKLLQDQARQLEQQRRLSAVQEERLSRLEALLKEKGLK
jgi:hypothetical protein